MSGFARAFIALWVCGVVLVLGALVIVGPLVDRIGAALEGVGP